MSRSAPLIICLARLVAGEAEPKDRVRGISARDSRFCSLTPSSNVGEGNERREPALSNAEGIILRANIRRAANSVRFQSPQLQARLKGAEVKLQ